MARGQVCGQMYLAWYDGLTHFCVESPTDPGCRGLNHSARQNVSVLPQFVLIPLNCEKSSL